MSIRKAKHTALLVQDLVASSTAHIFLQYPVPMRAAPAQTSTGNFQIIDGGSRTVTAFQLIDATSFNARLDCTASGQTQGEVVC